MIKDPVCIYIHKKHTKKIMSFAEKVSLTTDYSDCQQNNYKLKVYQHYIGKLGELAVYLFLRKDFKISKPDFTIYKTKDKSWDSDLKIGNEHISIKTQDLNSAKSFGLSWTFQKISNGRTDSAIQDNPIIIPTIYDNSYYDKSKIVIFPSIRMQNAIFGKPKKENLKDKKLVMYAKDNYKDYKIWLETFNLN